MPDSTDQDDLTPRNVKIFVSGAPKEAHNDAV